ncbi:MAG TPA: hypothetical protein PKD92_10905 [Novosphingobium sp.]|nr:hypothetical protein [Novosphingobium sp.]
MVAAGVTAGFSLLFAAGTRPGVAEVERLLQTAPPANLGSARISHRPADDEGWLELLASGLTFDLAGLAPAPPAPLPRAVHRFGIGDDTAGKVHEAVSLLPGEHIMAGSAQVTVVRVMAGLAARLVGLGGVRAVAWHPAASWMEAGYFTRVVAAWLAGGVFPALGLTAFESTADGGIESVGLAFFTGQELRVEALAGEARADTVKLAVRAVDMLVRHGPLADRFTLIGPSGEPLVVEPDAGGKVLRLWREG